MKRIFSRERSLFFTLLCYGIVSLFSFFLPTLYTLSGHDPQFVNGFIMLRYMEDSFVPLHYGTILMLIGYVFGGLLVLIGLFGLFIQIKNINVPFAMGLIVTLAKLVCEIVGIVFLNQCQPLSIYLEFGSYAIVILSGIVFIAILLSYLFRLKRPQS